jgi:hypothetical protein
MRTLSYIGLWLFATVSLAQAQGRFELIADYRGIGGVDATAVGPGPAPGSERLYVSYTYNQNTFDILSIDPATGASTVITNPIAGEFVGYGLVPAADGNIYLGTAPRAHFMKLDPRRGVLVDLGRPATSEENMFDLAFGIDGRLYGVTYPNAKLVRYTPRTGALEDLGRLDPSEQYAHYIVSSPDGFLYVGIGSSKANVAVYQIATMQRKEILPPDAQVAGIAKVYRGQDGNVYAAVGSRVFRCDHWTATEMTNLSARPPEHSTALHDGRVPQLTGDHGHLKLALSHPGASDEVDHDIRYQGQKLALFRIAFGPDNVLYGSSVLPIHFVQFDLARHSVAEIGDLGAGEIYSFLNHGNRLVMGAYAAQAPLMSYDPAAPFHPGVGTGNPLLFSPRGFATAWRPMAMVEGPDHAVYVGSIATYGVLESPLLKFSPDSGTFTQYPVVHDQSIASLAVWHNLIVGGSSIRGGAGSHPTQTSACIFGWNPATGQKEFELPAVAGKAAILDLIVAPNDHIYGFADDVLFEFDPRSRTIVNRQPLPFSPPLYDSVAVDRSGIIWGLAKEGIFTINTRTSKVQLVARPPADITAGFAMRDGKIYFIAGSSVYSYTM